MDGHVYQVRRAAPGLWVITDAGDDAPLQGPDRLGNHSASFPTMVDAAHAAQWRADSSIHDGETCRVVRGPAW